MFRTSLPPEGGGGQDIPRLYASAAYPGGIALAKYRADLIFTGGAVYTVDAARRWAQAVAVGDGKIAAVGTDEQVRALAGRGTEVVDLAGRMLLPGFQDAHCHPPGGGYDMLHCNLNEAYSLEEYERIIASTPRTTRTRSGSSAVAGPWTYSRAVTPRRTCSTVSFPIVPSTSPAGTGTAFG
jgi:predicted amidohydrolase YtcJ